MSHVFSVLKRSLFIGLLAAAPLFLANLNADEPKDNNSEPKDKDSMPKEANLVAHGGGGHGGGGFHGGGGHGGSWDHHGGNWDHHGNWNGGYYGDGFGVGVGVGGFGVGLSGDNFYYDSGNPYYYDNNYQDGTIYYYGE